MTEHIDSYLDFKRLSGSGSAHTLKASAADLKHLREYLEKNQISLEQLDLGNARAWAAWLSRLNLGGRSIARHLSTARSFYHYLLIRKLVSTNPFIGLRAPKYQIRLPEILSVDQILALMRSKDSEKPLELRDQCMLECLYSCALRISELVSVDINDLNMKTGVIRVKGKGASERLIPIGENAMHILVRWLKVRSTWVKDDCYAVFINRFGTRLTARSVQLSINKLGKKSGFASNIYPHLLRHSCATHMLESSNNLRMVQEFLGHARLDTTQIYTQVNFRHLSKQYDQFHPRAKRTDSS